MEMYKAGCDLQDLQMMYQLNKETEITIDTPFGKTEKLNVGEIVKQGTVLGPQFCCVETDQINKIGEHQEKYVGEQLVGILVFVDDVMAAGTAEEIRRAIRNFAEMEKLKKFTYGLKKTKYMVMKTGKEETEEIKEHVKGGMVGKTDQYKYVGVWVNEEGNLFLHIDKKKKNMKGQVINMMSLASYHNVGSMFVNTRLQLYESCIVKSIMFNIEGWNKVSNKEMKKLESIQHQALCMIMHLPKTAPYIALLNEVGMWRMEERLMYRKIMLLHNILNSNDDRLIKRMIIEQEEDEEESTWYDEAAKYLACLHMNVEMVRNMSKSELKKTVKERITLRMERIIKTTGRNSTKMRFVNCDKLERKPYITNGSGTQAIETMKTRLNMQPVYGNYKGNLKFPRMCEYCHEHEDTTEHLITCESWGNSNLEVRDLHNEQNVTTWVQINERIRMNLKWRT